MKVGDYVRTNWGEIGKITYINSVETAITTDYFFNKNIRKNISVKSIIKSSPNIIDLIEVGDYVNGHQVLDIAEAPKRVLYLNDISQKGALIPRKNIKSIVTKEQFSQMEYKVGE